MIQDLTLTSSKFILVACARVRQDNVYIRRTQHRVNTNHVFTVYMQKVMSQNNTLSFEAVSFQFFLRYFGDFVVCGVILCSNRLVIDMKCMKTLPYLLKYKKQHIN